MSQSPDDEYREWVRRLRDQSRRDAESLVPRRYWSEHLAWLRVEPDAAERLALTRTREALAEDWLLSWTAWAATA
jgi:hypothetical protein